MKDRTRIKQPKLNLVTVGRDSSFPYSEAVTKEKQEREDDMAVEKQERKNAVAAALRQCVEDTSAALRRELNALLHVCILYRRQAHPHVLSPRTPSSCTTLRGLVPQSSARWTMTHIVRPRVALCPDCKGESHRERGLTN